VGLSAERLRLELAKKRGDDLKLPRSRVYRALMGDTVAAQRFLEEEQIGTGDVLDPTDMIPIPLLRRRIDSHFANDEWHLAMQSHPLILGVEKVIVQVGHLQDQGHGNQKGNLGLALYDTEGVLVTRCNLFGTIRSPGYAFDDSPCRVLLQDEDVVANAQPGFSYHLEYTVGGGGGHSLHITNWLCKIYPLGWTEDLASYRFVDPEDDEGLYVGSADTNGRAHGLGHVLYDDGEIFAGLFTHGSMTEGVIYSSGQREPQHTMQDGSWDMASDVDGNVIVARYPVEADWLNDSSDSDASIISDHSDASGMYSD